MEKITLVIGEQRFRVPLDALRPGCVRLPEDRVLFGFCRTDADPASFPGVDPALLERVWGSGTFDADPSSETEADLPHFEAIVMGQVRVTRLIPWTFGKTYDPDRQLYVRWHDTRTGQDWYSPRPVIPVV